VGVAVIHSRVAVHLDGGLGLSDGDRRRAAGLSFANIVSASKELTFPHSTSDIPLHVQTVGFDLSPSHFPWMPE
jgi:hypothetical protein